MKARYLLKMAADQGNPSGEFNLGVLYEHGRGVPRDYAKAAYWYRKGADQGNAYAEKNLAVLYVFGAGVPQNIEKAYMWLDLAVAHGDTSAATLQDKVANSMTPAQLAEAKHLASAWKPSVSH